MKNLFDLNPSRQYRFGVYKHFGVDTTGDFVNIIAVGGDWIYGNLIRCSIQRKLDDGDFNIHF